MAWRIHDMVQRGEIDNRERGFVRGRLWLHGLADAVVLELRGNAAPDLAGCLLTFKNPGETFPMPADAPLHSLQRGPIGDLTASRKVRVWDIPFTDAYERKQQGLPVPEHWANCLYLEWFSEANGRVVLESADYRLTISAPAWRLTQDEERQRQRQAAESFAGFMAKLSDALDAAKHEPAEDRDWDEFDYEKLLRESDARTDKYIELLDKYLDHPDRDHIIAKEMGWSWLEEALDEEEDGSRSEKTAPSGPPAEDAEGGPETEADDPFTFEELEDAASTAPNPATEGVDWVRDQDGDISHPLSLRAFQASMAFWNQCDDLHLSKADDEDLSRLISEYQITSAKLAGALNSLAYGRDLCEGAFIVACLKRALSHLHGAQTALEKVTRKNLLPAATLASTRAELFALREEILRLMKEFRGRS
jgi:hypothetical protein